MSEILLYISSGLIIFSFIYYGILILLNKNKQVSQENSFDITKDIIQEYDSINIIENTGLFTYYNPKREVIRLNSNSYYGNDLSRISISLLEAGISVVDKIKNKYLNLFKKIFNNLKIVYLFSLLALGINLISNTVSDAKIGIILLIGCSIINYMYIDILNESMEWVKKNIKKIKKISKDNSEKIINYINKIIWINKLLFIGELIIILRMVAIILSM